MTTIQPTTNPATEKTERHHVPEWVPQTIITVAVLFLMTLAAAFMTALVMVGFIIAALPWWAAIIACSGIAGFTFRIWRERDAMWTGARHRWETFTRTVNRLA